MLYCTTSSSTISLATSYTNVSENAGNQNQEAKFLERACQFTSRISKKQSIL